MNKQIKCRLCDRWYEAGELEACPVCAYPSSDPLARRTIAETSESKPAFSIDLKRSLWPLKPRDSFLVRAVKYAINSLFLIYLIIMGLISYIAVAAIG